MHYLSLIQLMLPSADAEDETTEDITVMAFKKKNKTNTCSNSIRWKEPQSFRRPTMFCGQGPGNTLALSNTTCQVKRWGSSSPNVLRKGNLLPLFNRKDSVDKWSWESLWSYSLPPFPPILQIHNAINMPKTERSCGKPDLILEVCNPFWSSNSHNIAPCDR